MTEKADGIRAELYINTIGEAYLITQKLKVISTGWVFQDITEEWLFDGEYITEDKNGAPIDLYMIFDIYYGGEGGEVLNFLGNVYPPHNQKNRFNQDPML